MTRLSLTLALLLLVACGGPPAAENQPPEAPAITHGPVLGRVAADRIAVWARTKTSGSFHVFYGTSPDDLSQQAGPVETLLEKDNTGWIEITGLAPGTKYFYEISTGDGPAGVERLRGHFHTLPTAESVADPVTNPDGLFNFRFEFATGNNQKTMGGTNYGPELPTYKTMLRELIKDDEHSRVDFGVLNGDWLYEENREYPLESWLDQVGISMDQAPRVVDLMPTIVGVWENYKTFLSRGVPLAAWHRHVPSYYTFDDHELLSDVIGAGETGFRNRKAVARDITTQAWYDYLGWSNEVPPTQEIAVGRANLEAGSNVLTAPYFDFSTVNFEQVSNLHVHWGNDEAVLLPSDATDKEHDPNAGVYEITDILDEHRLEINPPAAATRESVFSLGRRSYFKKRVSNTDIYFLDTRSNRELHDVTKPRNVGKSMIGVEQREWLMEEMRASDADFSFVISSVNFTIPHRGGNKGAGGALGNKDDAWTVFTEERDLLIDFWDSLGKPVFVLTGDLHNSFAIRITDNVWEFASGPHNSVNHPLNSEGDRQPNGPFEYDGRKVEIRWSSFMLPDTPVELRNRVIYCVVRINNVWRNPKVEGETRWVAYPQPQAIFQYYDGLTGELLYAESILAKR